MEDNENLKHAFKSCCENRMKKRAETPKRSEFPENMKNFHSLKVTDTHLSQFEGVPHLTCKLTSVHRINITLRENKRFRFRSLF